MTPDEMRRAIVLHRQVVATFQGHVREFCPHVLGAYKSEWRVLAWQFAGGSSKGLAPGGAWRCFALAGLTNGVLRSGQWHRGVSNGWDPNCIDTIDTEVDAAFSARVKKR